MNVTGSSTAVHLVASTAKIGRTTSEAERAQTSLRSSSARASVVTGSKPRLERPFYSAESARPKRSSAAVVEAYLDRAREMLVALRRLSIDAPPGAQLSILRKTTVAASVGWTYRFEVEFYDGGGVRITEGLYGTSLDDALAISTGDASGAEPGQGSMIERSVPSIYAGAGNDSIALSTRSVWSVDGEIGDDSISIDAMEVWSVNGGSGADAVAVAASAVWSVDGDKGSDALTVSAQDVHSVDGGAGDDAIAVHGGDVHVVQGGGGRDVVTVGAADLHAAYGGAGDDALTVTAGRAFVIDGGAGNDTISATGTSLNWVTGGDGDDVIMARAERVGRLDGGAGDDVMRLDAEDAGLVVGPNGGDDTLIVDRVGVLAIWVDRAAAGSAEAVSVRTEGDTTTLAFAGGGSLTLRGVDAAEAITLYFDGAADGAGTHLARLENGALVKATVEPAADAVAMALETGQTLLRTIR